MYERSPLENGLTDLADFLFCCIRNCQNKVCMKDNFWKIHRKIRKFVTVFLRMVAQLLNKG